MSEPSADNLSGNHRRPDEEQTTEQCSAEVTVKDPMGLHLRAGKDVVRLACRYQSHITAQNLSRASATVDVKSILQLMQLQARKGHVLLLSATGPDAHDAVQALVCLF